MSLLVGTPLFPYRPTQQIPSSIRRTPARVSLEKYSCSLTCLSPLLSKRSPSPSKSSTPLPLPPQTSVRLDVSSHPGNEREALSSPPHKFLTISNRDSTPNFCSCSVFPQAAPQHALLPKHRDVKKEENKRESKSISRS